MIWIKLGGISIFKNVEEMIFDFGGNFDYIPNRYYF